MTKSDHKCENCSDSKDERIKELQIKLTERNNEILILKDKLIENQRIVERLKLELNNVVYMKNTINENIPCQSTTHEILQEWQNKLQSILKGGKE